MWARANNARCAIAWLGSLLARLAAGDALADAVRYANVSAALSTQGHGAVAPIPTAERVRAAMNTSVQA